MKKLAEKILAYAMGGMAGVAVASVFLSFNPLYVEGGHGSMVAFICFLIGIIIAAIAVSYSDSRTYDAGRAIQNEAVALITHEMRTSLTSTSWAIQMMLEDYAAAISEGDKKMLRDMISSINTTVMHSVNLLDISLLDIGKLSISLEWKTLGEVESMLREIIEKFQMGAEKAGIRLDADIRLDSRRLMQADLMRLRIVLENLLENSIQYAGAGKKEIAVRIGNSASVLDIEVRDTGIGIPLEDQGRIFGEFFRASNARKKLSSGSGIGLYMCRQYVRAHRGTIRFKSQENQGTSFFISIPLKTAADTQEFLAQI